MEDQSTTDAEIGEKAEREAIAHLTIVQALKPLDQSGRDCVLRAVEHLLKADREVPGVLNQFVGNRQEPQS